MQGFSDKLNGSIAKVVKNYSLNLKITLPKVQIITRQLFDIKEKIFADEKHLESTINWLKCAQDVVIGGGVSGLFSLNDGWYAGYPETTGYIIETFLEYYKDNCEIEYLERSKKMADWELKIQLEDGGVRGGCYKDKLGDSPVVFNTGQVLLGLNAMYRCTKDKRYIDAAQKSAEWLIKNQDDTGLWNNFVYQNHCGPYHSKVAWALLQTANELNRDDFKQGAVKFLKWVLLQQNENCYFENCGFKPKKPAFTHNIAYTLEGLIGSSEELIMHDKDFANELISAFLRTCEKLLLKYELAHKLYGEYDENWSADKSYICLTGCAQTALCFLKAYRISKDIRFVNAALKLIDDLKASQVLDHPNIGIKGGVAGSYPVWGSYQKWSFVNWGAKYFCDVLIEKKNVLKTIL